MTPDNIDNNPANNRQKYAESNRQRMTPARQPQKEYIITEEDILILEDTFGVTMIMPRSRPHTSPPAPTAPFDLDADRMYTSDEVKKAYTSGAKAAREQVLDELLAWLEGHWTLTRVKHYGAWTTQQSLEYKTTIRKIESLRAQQEQPK